MGPEPAPKDVAYGYWPADNIGPFVRGEYLESRIDTRFAMTFQCPGGNSESGPSAQCSATTRP